MPTKGSTCQRLLLQLLPEPPSSLPAGRPPTWARAAAPAVAALDLLVAHVAGAGEGGSLRGWRAEAGQGGPRVRAARLAARLLVRAGRCGRAQPATPRQDGQAPLMAQGLQGAGHGGRDASATSGASWPWAARRQPGPSQSTPVPPSQHQGGPPHRGVVQVVQHHHGRVLGAAQRVKLVVVALAEAEEGLRARGKAGGHMSVGPAGTPATRRQAGRQRGSGMPKRVRGRCGGKRRRPPTVRVSKNSFSISCTVSTVAGMRGLRAGSSSPICMPAGRPLPCPAHSAE